MIAYQDDDNFVKLVYRSNPRFGRGGGGSSGVLDMIVESKGYYFSLANPRSNDVITDNNYTLDTETREKRRDYYRLIFQRWKGVYQNSNSKHYPAGC